MPTITLSDRNYAKLQSVATPFVDTEDAVAGRVLDFYLENNDHLMSGNGRPASSAEDLLHLNPDGHDGVSHTRLLSTTIDGAPIHRPNWNKVREQIHLIALKRFGTYEELQKVSDANLRQGKYEENGYKYLPDGDFSIQSVGADLAWSHSLQLARTLNVPINVTFEWRDKEGAAHPGKRGVLAWQPERPITE